MVFTKITQQKYIDKDGRLECMARCHKIGPPKGAALIKTHEIIDYDLTCVVST